MRTSTRTSSASEQTEGRIYEEAVRLFWERGYHGTSLRDIALASGVQISTFYYYFPSKQDLLVSIMRTTMEDLTKSVMEAEESQDDPSRRLLLGIHAHIRFHAERSMEAVITDSELRALEPENRQSIVTMRDQYERIFRDILIEGVERGLFAATDVRLAIYALMSMCTAVAVWFQPNGRFTIDEIAEHYVALFLEGVERGEDDR